MASGKRSAHEGRRRPALTLPRALALLGAALALSTAVACGSERGFSSALAGLDVALGSKDSRRIDSAFGHVYRRAASAADWLSVLKRARASEAAGEAGRFLDAARRAVSSIPTSEPVAAATAYAMLRGGEPESALALFRGALSPESRPALWAEAFVTAARSGRLAAYRPSPADFARLAEIAGDAHPYAAAAALALYGQDAAQASSWASRAVQEGVDLPASLLWDCGMHEALAGRSDVSAPASDLAIMGDAAWVSGDPELASSRWEASIAADPRRSWKPYAKLALSSGDRARAESYWRRMRAAFLEGGGASSPEAAAAMASAYAAAGRNAEALAILRPQSSDTAASALALRIAGAGFPEDRLAFEALRFAEGGAGDAAGYALAILVERDRVDDMLALFDSAGSKGLEYPDRWFYSAAASAARGDYALAAAAIEGGGPAARVPEAFLALGIVYRAMGEGGKAATELRAAATASGEAALRCAALKELGGTLSDMGDASGAAGAYRAAAQADPGDSSAAMLARALAAP